jgi:UDP-N-acetylmuramyl tripeptide synthase
VKIAAGFTNITRDHLDYRELANYPTAKLRLFRELVKPAASQW